MKKVHRLPTASTAAAKPAAAFFQLCGSPIRTDVQLTYDDDDARDGGGRCPATPQTPPVASRARPLTQEPVTQSPQLLLSVGGESKEEDEGEEEQKDVAAIVTDETTTLPTRKASPLSLAKAKKAGIPCFLSDRFESKTDLPSTAASTGASSPLHASISMSDLQLGRIIGEGAFGRVYEGRWHSKKVAIKMLIRQNLSEDVVREFETEVKIMSYLNHPNICRLLGACLEPSHRALVVELMTRGCLWNLLRSHRRDLSSRMRGKMVVDIARGMHYLHSFERPILHRDMKSPNLLVENDFSIKISDFGLARVKAQIQTMTGNCGTVQWMAPEVLGNRKYTEKADVYSFAIVVWEIFTGRCPYDGMTQIQAALSVLNHDLRPSIPTSCPPFIARLIKMCWTRDPELRPSFDFVVHFLEQHEHLHKDQRARQVKQEIRAAEHKQRYWKP